MTYHSPGFQSRVGQQKKKIAPEGRHKLELGWYCICRPSGAHQYEDAVSPGLKSRVIIFRPDGALCCYAPHGLYFVSQFPFPAYQNIVYFPELKMHSHPRIKLFAPLRLCVKSCINANPVTNLVSPCDVRAKAGTSQGHPGKMQGLPFRRGIFFREILSLDDE